MSDAWFPYLPVWEWNGINGRYRARSRERFHERTAAIRGSGQSPGVSELRAYSELIDVMHGVGVFRSEHMKDNDVIRQLHRAELFARHDAIGRRILAGTWPKRTPGAPKSVLREGDLCSTSTS